MTRRKWGKVAAGDVVELKGEPWRVTKAKRKGDRLRVTVERGGLSFTRELDASAKVELVRRAGDSVFASLAKQAKAGPLHDKSGAMTRWAEPDEVTPPGKGDRWGEPASDPAGQLVERVLGGRLVAATRDGERWAVPPVELTTVRAHLAIFHGIPGNEQPLDEARCLALHRELHERADHEPSQPHEHTKRVPA